MACCSIKRSAQTSWASIAVVCVPLHLFGTPLGLLLWGLSRLVPGLRESHDGLACLLIRNRKVMDERMRALRWRCIVAGHLLPLSPRLAGLAYRSFYPTLASFGWLVAAGTLLGLALAPLVLL